MFNQITILGSGLLGASIGMALKKSNLAQSVKVWARRRETLIKCSAQDWCDYVEYNLQKSVKGSELIIICTPVESITNIIKKIAGFIDEGAIITDVGSVKEDICRYGENEMKDLQGHFIGSHPMAGSENSGMDFANEDLFEGKPCIITPVDQKDKSIIKRISNFWTSLGMIVYQFSPREHDNAVAYYSHLPHLLSSCLATHLSTMPREWMKISGNGLKDTTRIAAGDPDLWKQIFKMNKENLMLAVNDWQKTLLNLQDLISKEDDQSIKSFLEKGSKFRKEL